MRSLRSVVIITAAYVALTLGADASPNGFAPQQPSDPEVLQALDPIAVGGGWSSFNWGLQVLPGDATPTFEFNGSGIVTVVDAFCTGDRFQVYDNGVLLGITSPAQPPTCDFPEATDNPDVALTLPQFYTQGVFAVGAGAHSILVEVVESYGEPGDYSGAAFIRVDAAPPEAIPTTSPLGLVLLLAAMALAGLLLVRRHVAA